MHKRTKMRFAILGALTAGLCVTAAMAAPEPVPAGVRLLTETEYRNSIADIFGPNIAVQGRFEPGRRIGGLIAASTTVLSVTPAGFEAFSKMADSIAVQVVDAKNRSKLVPCTPKNEKDADSACAGKFLGQYGRLLFRRPLASDELKSRVDLADKLAKSSGDFYYGLRYSLGTLLSAPSFLFRTELAVPAGKEYTLDGYSRASRLSFLMWDSTPDNELLRAADSGELMTAAGVSKQVDRLMTSPRLEVGMRAFFADMLQLDTFSDITKDVQIYQKFTPQMASSAQEETLRTVINLTLRENRDVRDLMTTRKTYLDRTLSSIYKVPFNSDTDWMPYEFSASSGRNGVLTQASMLAMFSHPGRSSPTKRGVALMDIFLCEPTPLPPANVDFSVVNDVNNPKLKTVRDRLLAHATNATCASCHNHSDPIGLSLEHFDSLGSLRMTENGQAIDVSAKIGNKSFVGADGLAAYLHDSPKVPACLARKLYSYGVGASSEDVDPAQFKDAYASFTGGGYRLRTLLKGLATSPAFFSAPAPTPVSTEHQTKTASR
jgi:hypothetical protein